MNPKAPSLLPGNRATVQPAAEAEPAPTPASQNSETTNELPEQCKDLALEPRILDRFAEDLEGSGVVGEEQMGKLLYLAVNSRFLHRPVSVAVKGTSSSGKSTAADAILTFFPTTACKFLSSMSPKALIYDPEPISHRMLVLAEGAALHGAEASYLMRTLLSEGRIVHCVTEKGANGKHKGRTITREGPTGLILTTTQIQIDSETETRLFSISSNDTPKQTRDVLLELARNQREFDLEKWHVDLEKWHALHHWIANGKHRVQIPYAEFLAELFPTNATRLRRDFGRLLGLICSHAILHQATRERDEEDRIIAIIDDYSVVRDLCDDLIAESLEASVAPAVRETVDAVRKLTSEYSLKRSELRRDGMAEMPVAITQKVLAAELGIDKGTISRRVGQAIGAGYLINRQERSGRPMNLEIDEPMPSDGPVLPTAVDVQRIMDSCTVAQLRGDKGQTQSNSEETQENSARFEV